MKITLCICSNFGSVLSLVMGVFRLEYVVYFKTFHSAAILKLSDASWDTPNAQTIIQFFASAMKGVRDDVMTFPMQELLGT